MSAAPSLALPSARYAAGVAAQHWQDDPAQRAVLPAFDRLHAESGVQFATQPGLLQRLGQHLRAGSTPTPLRGLYLWGRVGRGKTFLMDLFCDGLPAGRAERWHFHRFMGMVHDELARLQGTSDPLLHIGARIGARIRVLCLDEFQVSDIGDAMILTELLRGLINAGVTLVTTSNTPPTGLYREGLQRARFVPAIELLQQHCEVIELASAQDWRLRALKQAPTWLTPLGAQTERRLEQIFQRLAHGVRAECDGRIEVLGRSIACKRAAAQVIWFDFDALCGDQRAVADYIEIGRAHDAVLISAVPQFNVDREDPALRFVQMVDEFYDRQVKLVCSAAVPIIELYEGERLRAEFARGESRLIEMQSEDYLTREHHA
ncbi:MAG: cell division protein ZapE [Metallibacterium sp.]